MQIPDLDKKWAQLAPDLERILLERRIQKRKRRVKVVIGSVFFIAVIFTFAFFEVFRTDVVRTGEGETLTIVLSDGTEVTLNEQTRFEYPRYFGFRSRRTVELDGEAFFSVSKDSLKPFQVVGSRSVVTVLGTKFNLSDRKEGKKARISLEEGRVRFYSTKHKRSLVMTSGTSTGLTDMEFGTDERFGPNDFSWKTGQLVFEGVPVIEVLEDIEAHYKVRFSIKSVEIPAMRFTGVFKDARIEEVIEVLKYTLDLNVEKVGNRYDLTKNKFR